MFTNMLTSHHPHYPHRPLSPSTSMTSLSTPNYSSEQKFAPLHNAADAMRKMGSPYSVGIMTEQFILDNFEVIFFHQEYFKILIKYF